MDRRETLKCLSKSLGITISASSLSAILLSCKSIAQGANEQGGEDQIYRFKFLNKKQRAFVSGICDAILPTNTTVGAKDLNLIQFIDLMIIDSVSNQNQQIIISGLSLLRTEFIAKLNRPVQQVNKRHFHHLISKYFELSEAQQQNVFSQQQLNINSLNENERDDYCKYKCLLTLRRLVLLGFYTSEEVGKNVLSYDPIPGKYQPCIDVNTVGNAWTY